MSEACPASDRPCTALRNEHRVIERVLKVLANLVRRFRSGGSFEKEAFIECIRFLRLFADSCHHGKEETLLFPALEARGIPREHGPIGVMLHEHQVGRELVRRMADAIQSGENGNPTAGMQCVEAAEQLIGHLSQHIAKEDNILFVMGERVLSETDRQQLCTGFNEVSCRQFEGRSKAELERLAAELETRWAATAT
ncbi:MAG: hemerythrin domain-containing protein [Tepidisphaeraceae bacterium]|jgi:hemerythrin-like domain-containing protein